MATTILAEDYHQSLEIRNTKRIPVYSNASVT